MVSLCEPVRSKTLQKSVFGKRAMSSEIHSFLRTQATPLNQKRTSFSTCFNTYDVSSSRRRCAVGPVAHTAATAPCKGDQGPHLSFPQGLRPCRKPQGSARNRAQGVPHERSTVDGC
jgi:hypothetical protein